MSLEENKQLIRAHFEELMNNKNLSKADDHLATDFIDHEAPPGFQGVEGVKRYLAGVREAFPNMHVTIKEMIAEDDRIVVRNTWRGTHQKLE